MHKIGLWKDGAVESGGNIIYAISIPQESVTIQEPMDGIRAALKMRGDSVWAPRKQINA